MKLLLRSLLAAVLGGTLAAGVYGATRVAQSPQATPAAESPAQVEKELREFVPSEEIPADSAVSFPSDI